MALTHGASLRRLVFSLILALSRPSFVAAQEPDAIKVEPACQDCHITVHRELDLGTADGPGIVEHSQSRAVRDSRGRYYLIGSYSTEIKVFGPDGRFLRTIGRKGGGPGEYEGIGSILVTPGDSLMVLDWGLSRMTFLDPGYHLIRTVRLPLRAETQTARLGGSLVAVAVPLATPKSVGQPIQVVSLKGRLERSIGSPTGMYRPDIPYLDRRAIAPAGGTRVWSAYRTKYQIDLFDAATGRLLRSLVQNPDWFPPRMKPVSGPEISRSQPPQPFVKQVHQDAAGLLWVMVSVADPEWRNGLASAEKGDSHVRIDDDSRYTDTRIDVIDPRRGKLLATVRLDQALTQIVSDNQVAAVVLDSAGVPRFRIWRISFIHTQGGGR